MGTLNLDVIREPTRPISAIADKIEPFLRVLAEEFEPERIIIFGSYAYGTPTRHSDLDLLVVKKIEVNNVKDAVAIYRRWGEVIGRQPIPIELLLETPQGHQERLQRNGAFYRDIVGRGLRVL